MEAFISYISVALGIASLIYAYFTNREKARLERIVQVNLQRIAGNIDAITVNTVWAWKHFDNVRNNIGSMEASENLNSILESLQHGMGDITAADKMSRNLLNEVVGIQEGLFGTTKIVCPKTHSNLEHDSEKNE